MSNYKKRRGRCPVCGRTRSVNVTGRMREHPKPKTNGTVRCPGSGAPPL